MTDSDDYADLSAMPWQQLVVMLGAVMIGAGAAVFVLPRWLPNLSYSLLAPEAKAYWYLSRSSAVVAYLLLWLAMALGVMITNKMARIWPGGPTAFELHQHASLLGLALALFHALILLGDQYINYTLWQVLLPFASQNYEPFWVGWGQVAFYLLAIVALSFYVRRQITRRVWRLIHYLSFVLYLLALGHSLMSGSDSGVWWIQGMYWLTGGVLLFLVVYRVLFSLTNQKRRRAKKKGSV